MRYGFVIAYILVSGCATLTKPSYDAVTNFAPDCANAASQIRYLTDIKRFPSTDMPNDKFNRTIDIQIERLAYYCYAD